MFLTASLNKCKIKAYVYRCMECMVAQTQKLINMTLVAVMYGRFPNWQGGFDKRDFINIYSKDIKGEPNKQNIFKYCCSFGAIDVDIVYSPIV